jgi:hypothetical protein
MANTRSIGAVLESAEQAAAAGDHPTAERWLREAVALQEGELGHLHPDLANTLNNLGVICERVGKLDDAEQCYRRAYGIAKRVLVPDHVFVMTAEQNLRQFCAARGVPFASATSAHGLARVGPEGQSDRSLEANFASETMVTLEGPAFGAAAPGGVAHDRLVPDETPGAAARLRPVPAGPASTAPSAPSTASSQTTAAPGEVSAVSGHGAASRPPAGSRGPAAASPTLAARAPATPATTAAAPTLAVSAGSSHAMPSAAAAHVHGAAHTGTASAPKRLAGRKYLLAVLIIAIALVSVWLISAWRLSRGDVPQETATSTAPASATASAPTAAPLDPSPASVSEAAPRQEGAASVRPSAPTAAGNRNAPTVVRAAVCRRFATQGTPDWQCEPAGAEARPGALVYYTRIAAPRDTAVEHRWYQGDALEQRVALRIRASGTGYRTYSRRTAGAGTWRVELRSATGDLLHEERFVVR